MDKTLNDFPILVIMGKAGAGKDTLAEMIKEYIFGTAPVTLKTIRFSDPLKNMCAAIFGWERSCMEDLAYKEEILKEPMSCELGIMLRTRREVFQYLGSLYRQMNINVWVDASMRKATEDLAFNYPDGYISTDCRYQNEQAAICSNFKEHCFVKLHRTGNVVPITAASDHESETGFDDLYCNMEFYVEDGDMVQMRSIARMIGTSFFSHLGVDGAVETKPQRNYPS